MLVLFHLVTNEHHVGGDIVARLCEVVRAGSEPQRALEEV